MKRALVCVSFGTTVENGRMDLMATEDALRAAASGCHFVRALTSRIIRKRLAERGKTEKSLPEVLDELSQEGFDDVAVQPTHLLYGYEYDKIKAEIAPYRARFSRFVLGKPLLSDTDSLRQAAKALGQSYPTNPAEILLFMGHGTEHFAGTVYPALQSVFTLQKRMDVFVATVEGWPSLADVLPQIQQTGLQRVHLVPLMLVAGDHACHDMAGDDPQSWKSQLEAAGFTVRCTLEGLGRLPGIQQMYCAKLKDILE